MIWTKQQLQEYRNKIEDTQICKLEEIKENRSQAQNRLYHKWLSDLNWELDNKWIFITTNDLHEGLRDKLIKWTYKTNTLTWRRLVERKSTTKLTKKEFSQYLKDIEKYLRQTFEITHPMPTDLFYNK